MELERELFLRILIELYCVDQKDLDKVIIAYTPTWSVGNSKAAGAPHIKLATTLIRKSVTKIFGEDAIKKIRIIYEGSVSLEYCITMIKKVDLDEVLLGSFGSDSNRLHQIVDAAKRLKHNWIKN